MRPVAVILTLCACCMFHPHALGAGLTEWVYDGDLTLSLDVTRVKTADGPAIRMRASAYLPISLVEQWTDTSAQARLADGSDNPDMGKSRGYRVRIGVTKGAKTITPDRVEQGAGPLADWLGVYGTRIRDAMVFKRAGKVSATVMYPADGPATEYTFKWYVDSRLARTEKVQLPQGAHDGTGADLSELKSLDRLGLYPRGSQLGADYKFTLSRHSTGCPGADSGKLVAALAPDSARRRLGLDVQPAMPILIGWQPDCGNGLSVFFSAIDSEIGMLPQIPDAVDLRPGSRADARPEVATHSLRDPATDTVQAVVSTSPGATCERLATGELFLEQGVFRICALNGSFKGFSRLGSLSIDGMALVQVREGDIAIWCMTRSATVADRQILAGEKATWDGKQFTRARFPLSDMEDPFLRTAFRPDLSIDEPPSAERGLTGLIKRAVICRGVSRRNEPVGIGTDLPAGVNTITLFVEHQLPEGDAARVSLRLYQGDRVRSHHQVDVVGRGRFLVEFRPDGRSSFNSGRWRITIEVNGQFDRELAVTVGQPNG